ncbi:MAG: T9SS type A sorting domain-containing protein [Bacteroidota bacterium]
MKKNLLLLLFACLSAFSGMAQNVNVTFQVHNPDSTPVYVFGSWSGWGNWPGDAMAAIGSGYHQVTLSIPANNSYEFKFVNGNGPTLEPLDPSWSCTNGNAQYTNRTLLIGGSDTTLCFDWNSCTGCSAPVGNVGITFQVHNPLPGPVFVFGSWDWTSYPGVAMTSIGNGYYAGTIYLPAFTTYEFLFVSGSPLTIETLDPAGTCTNGNAQYTNRVINVGGSDTTICSDWDTCNSCTVVTQQRQATFRVENPPTTPVYLFGSWNGWSNWPGFQMNPIGNNVYEYTLPLTSNTPYEYLYVNGSNPVKETLDPSWPCTNGNGQYTNRTITMSSNDTNVCAVWSTCSSCTASAIGELDGNPIRLLFKEDAMMLASRSNGGVDAIEVYDISGRKLVDLHNGIMFNSWIPMNLSRSNMYIVRITANGKSTTLKALPSSY